MLRLILAVVSGPLVFGLTCVPTNWLVVKMFPTHFDERWVTRHTGLLVLLAVLNIVFAAASGLVAGWIAGDQMKTVAVTLCTVQLGVGIAIQRQYWEELPLWYHLSFFAFLIVGICLGSWVSVAAGLAKW